MAESLKVAATAERGSEPAEDTRARLPARALLIALAGLVGGNVAAVVGYSVGLSVTPDERVTPLVLSEFLLWGGMLWACVVASRRYGTGLVRADFAVRPRGTDAAWGLLFAVADWVAAGTVTWLVSRLGRSYAGSNDSIVTDVLDDPPALVATILFAVVGAPIVEELFFRGLVQRALESWAGIGVAVVLQALLFGAVHLAEIRGSGWLGLWLSLSAIGLVHGLVYQRFRRITTCMWTHALFNVTGVLVIVSAA